MVPNSMAACPHSFEPTTSRAWGTAPRGSGGDHWEGIVPPRPSHKLQQSLPFFFKSRQNGNTMALGSRARIKTRICYLTAARCCCLASSECFFLYRFVCQELTENVLLPLSAFLAPDTRWGCVKAEVTIS